MDNQHTQITGYRDLNEKEVALMNVIAEKGAELAALVDGVNRYLMQQKDAATNGTAAEAERIYKSEPQRWCALGRTHFQEGLMALTRAVAQPQKF